LKSAPILPEAPSIDFITPINGYVILIGMIVNRENLIKSLGKTFPFNLAVRNQIAALADRTEVVFFKRGDVIYHEGAAARYLYVVFEGQVEVIKEIGHSFKKKNIMKAGDLFGEDVLSEKNKRRTTARAMEDSLLIRIALPVLARFIQQNPDLRNYFQFISDTYANLQSRQQNFDLDNETVYFMGQPHKIFLVARACFLFIIAILAISTVQYLASVRILSSDITMGAFLAIIGVYFIWLFWNILEWVNHVFVFTNRRVINFDRKLFLYESREETPLDAVVSFTSQANFLGRQYGFGDLAINTFTGILELRNLPQIESAQKMLEYLTERAHEDHYIEEKQDFENLLRGRRGLNIEQPVEEKPDIQGSGRDRFSRKTHIYHTHWLFLLRKTILPFLVTVGSVLAFIFLSTYFPTAMQNAIVRGLVSILIAAAAGWWIYQFIDWRNDRYIITPEQIIDVYRHPLGMEDKRTAPLESIQSIRYQRQGLIGILFDYGTVYIKVGNEDFTFNNIHHPLKVQQTLFGYLEQANLIEKQANLVEQRRQMAEWMDTYQQFNKDHPEDTSGSNKLDKSE
jgi:uncharacterized membrane protein YdbT with pleckstrin-like domain